MTKPEMIIENWILIDHEWEDNLTVCVYGEVYNNPEFKNGANLRTSRLVKIDGEYIETLNSRYKLGKRKGADDE